MSTVTFQTMTRNALEQAVQLLGKTVGCTMGPGGRNVMIDRTPERSLITKDGVTVAKYVGDSNPDVCSLVSLMVEASKDSDFLSGDGTTTTIVILESIVTQFLSLTGSGYYHPKDILEGVVKAHSDIVATLKNRFVLKYTDERLLAIAKIAANGDDVVANEILGAFKSAGADGYITLKKGKEVNDRTVVSGGVTFDRGAMVGTCAENQTVTLSNPYILVADLPILNNKDIFDLLNKVVAEKRPILIVAESISEEVRSFLLMNRNIGVLESVIVKSYPFSEEPNPYVIDLAYATGAVHAHPSFGITHVSDIGFGHLGTAETVTVSPTQTVIVGGGGHAVIGKHVEALQTKAKRAETYRERVEIEKRIAALVAKMVDIHIGGYTEVEINERFERFADALNSVRAAVEGGVFIGGGLAFYRAAMKLEMPAGNDGFVAGYRVMLNAAKSCAERILANAAEPVEEVLGKISRHHVYYGYDVRRRVYGDMRDMQIYDSAGSYIQAMENAVSLAKTLLMCEVIVNSRPQVANVFKPGIL